MRISALNRHEDKPVYIVLTDRSYYSFVAVKIQTEFNNLKKEYHF